MALSPALETSKQPVIAVARCPSQISRCRAQPFRNSGYWCRQRIRRRITPNSLPSVHAIQMFHQADYASRCPVAFSQRRPSVMTQQIFGAIGRGMSPSAVLLTFETCLRFHRHSRGGAVLAAGQKWRSLPLGKRRKRFTISGCSSVVGLSHSPQSHLSLVTDRGCRRCAAAPSWLQFISAKYRFRLSCYAGVDVATCLVAARKNVASAVWR